MANLVFFNVGDVLLTYGMDMACHKCVVKTKVVEKNERGIVTYSDGCHILNSWENMEHYNDYFPYSEEQEKKMQEECDNEYNAWREACERQLERARKYCAERNEKTKNIIKEKGQFNGTQSFVKLSCKSTFFRWKEYAIYAINENLDMFGVAKDGDTMMVNIDDVAVPIKLEVEKEIDKLVA